MNEDYHIDYHQKSNGLNKAIKLFIKQYPKEHIVFYSTIYLFFTKPKKKIKFIQKLLYHNETNLIISEKRIFFKTYFATSHGITVLITCGFYMFAVLFCILFLGIQISDTTTSEFFGFITCLFPLFIIIIGSFGMGAVVYKYFPRTIMIPLEEIDHFSYRKQKMIFFTYNCLSFYYKGKMYHLRLEKSINDNMRSLLKI